MKTALRVFDRLALPVIAAPLFIISNPKLVIAQCTSGVVGSMPALNARPAAQLDEWLAEITEALDAHNRAHPDQPAAPFAINQIVHKSNDRLQHDVELCVKYKVPVIITSLGAREDVNQAIHSYGGVVMHDIINNKFAHKAIEKGADGLIAVGQVAKKYGLYTKVTGGQRVDLFGARVEQLPLIWEELIAAGFESGHAYGKSLRTVKSCVGSTWCRYGVQDSVTMAVHIENRYRGLRAPHKLKMAVSGCTRELVVIPGASHLFPEPGAIDAVARLAKDWFVRHLNGSV